MTTKGEAPKRAGGGLDLLAELDAIVDLGRRAPGSDAERRTAIHLEKRLKALGRQAETESLDIHPAWPLGYAILAVAAVAASVLSVSVPAAGAALAGAAVLLTFLDAGMLVPTVRRLLGRRASQNVVSWTPEDKPGAIVLVAHYDAGRAGLIRRPIGGLRPLLWAELAVLACTLLRAAGIDGTALTAVQFVPTLALIAAVALLTDVALSGTRGGENDNASGVVVVLRLADRFGDASALEYFNLHVLFTGAQKAGSAGMRAFLKRHRLPEDSTVVLNIDQVGSGDVRYSRREGALVTLPSHPQLVAVCDQIAEDGDDARAIVSRSASDASAAAAAGVPSVTVTCGDRRDHATGRVDEQALERAEAFCAELIERLDASAAAAAGVPSVTVTCGDRRDHATGRVDEQALERAEAFCAELIERLDAEVGPSLRAPGEETALSEPEAT